jgi:hypothetical protein
MRVFDSSASPDVVIIVLGTVLTSDSASDFKSRKIVMPEKKPNILFIMGDDIGWANISPYNLGMMA